MKSNLHDWLLTGIAAFIIGGFYWDLSEHMNGAVERFIRSSHIMVYIAVAFLCITLFYLSTNNSYKTYAVAWLGFLLLAGGGLADYFWHTMFGFETDIDAFVSPPHLLIMSGMFLLSSEPAYRGSYEEIKGINRTIVPLSIGFSIAVINYWLMFTAPGYFTSPGTYGAASFLFHTILVAAVSAILSRNHAGVIGNHSIALSIGYLGISIIVESYWLIGVMVLLGVSLDLSSYFRRTLSNNQFRLGFSVLPGLFLGLFYIAGASIAGGTWTVYWIIYYISTAMIVSSVTWLSFTHSISQIIPSNSSDTMVYGILALVSTVIGILVTQLSPYAVISWTSPSTAVRPNAMITTMVLFTALQSIMIHTWISIRNRPSNVLSGILWFNAAQIFMYPSIAIPSLMVVGTVMALIAFIERISRSSIMKEAAFLGMPLFQWSPVLLYFENAGLLPWGYTLVIGSLFTTIIVNGGIRADYILRRWS